MKKILKNIFRKSFDYSGIDKDSVALLVKFYKFYGYKCKKELALLFFGAILSGVIELLGLILLYVLIRLMIDIKSVDESSRVLRLFYFFGLKDRSLIIPFFGAAILSVFILKNIYIILYYHLQHLTIRKWKNEISNFLMERYLFSPYMFLLSYNSATVIRNVNSTVGAALNGFVLATLNYGANIITGIVMLSVLTLKYKEATFLIAIILVVSTYFQNLFLKQKSVDLGKEREELSTEQTKNVYQGLHAVKETKVVGKEKYFVDIFKEINSRSIDNEMKSMFYARLPAHLTEIVIIVSIIIITVAVLLDTSGDTALSVSSLGVLAAIAFRLAPIMNRTVSALQSISKGSGSMSILFVEVQKLKNLKFIAMERENIPKMGFEKQIELKKVSFSYPKTSTRALQDINLTINRGEFVGIVGSSGAGKTTLVDIILGLLEPATGYFFIDGVRILPENVRSWQKNIGYVPQGVFISDGSIAENVAFGVDRSKIDHKLLMDILKDVRLDGMVAEREEGVEYIVGENGRNLSGGQKQRLGIARALYLQSEVLVLDEATSALDVPTEVEISNAINRIRGEKTIIVIAHRLSTVFDADKIIYVDNAGIVDIGSYKELFDRNEDFNRLGTLAKVMPT